MSQFEGFSNVLSSTLKTTNRKLCLSRFTFEQKIPMNLSQTKEEVADIYVRRIIEQNKREYSETYDLGKKSMYQILAQKDATIYQLREIIRNNKLNGQVVQENKSVTLSNPFNQNWTWVSKIIYLLLEKNAPMRSQQMIESFASIDERMNISHDRVGYFSAFLTKAVKNERIVKIKVKGFKGNFYALPEWLVNGELPPTYYRKMNLFVTQ